MSRHSTSSVEQGELEASPDLRHSPQIVLEPDESSEPFDFVLGGRVEKSSRMAAVDISSPDRCVGFKLYRWGPAMLEQCAHVCVGVCERTGPANP